MAFFRSVRWVNGVYCPKCKSYNVNNRGNQGRTRRYVCKDCGANFNDFSGTIFHKSKIPLNVMLYILFNLDKKTTTQLSEELDYSRQCISRISKLFREKLLSNPEYFDIDEWLKNFFLKNSYCFLSISINFWRAEKFPMLAYWYIFFYFCNFYSANMLAYQCLTIVIFFSIYLVKSFKWFIFWCFSIISWNNLFLAPFF